MGKHTKRFNRSYGNIWKDECLCVAEGWGTLDKVDKLHVHKARASDVYRASDGYRWVSGSDRENIPQVDQI